MNDKLKGIIIGGVVLAALGGTLAVMKFTGLDTPTESSSETASSSSKVDESVQLIDKTAADITSIDVKNGFGGFTYTGASESGKENSGITELKGLALKTRTVSDIGEDTAQLKAYKLVESGAADLTKYGLTDAEAEFDVHFADGSERDFLIGIEAPQNRYRYLCEKGSSDVYMVMESLIKPYLNPKEDLVDTTLIESPEQTTTDSTIEFGKLTIHRSDLDYDMVFEQDDGNFAQSSSNMVSAQVMTEPIFAYLDGTRSTNVIYALYGLTAMTAEKVFPTEADLAEYGLDEPRCTVTFTGKDYDYKLDIGNEFHEENDKGEQQTAAAAYYCTIEGVDGKDCIWKVDASALPFVTVMPNDIISTLMTWNMVTDVSEIKLSGETEDTFALTIEGEGDDAQIAGVTCNGSEVDVESFKALYQYILTCPTKDGIWFEEPTGEAFRRIEVVCADGHSDVIELYKDTDRRAIVKLNGRPSYRIQSKWADRLTKNIEAVKTGGKVEEDY